MLVLSRKLGQQVVIGDNIVITVVAIQGSQVRLGFTAPANVVIRREELCDPRISAVGSPPKIDTKHEIDLPPETSIARRTG